MGVVISVDILWIIVTLSAIPLAARISCDIVTMVAFISQAYTLAAPPRTASILTEQIYIACRSKEGEQIKEREREGWREGGKGREGGEGRERAREGEGREWE